MSNTSLGNFVDTGITASTSAEVHGYVKGFGFYPSPTGEHNRINALDHAFISAHSGGDEGQGFKSIFYMRGVCNRNSTDGKILEIEVENGSESNVADSPLFTIRKTMGPFRLGMTWQQIPEAHEDPLTPPFFVQKHYEVIYHWFADADTVVQYNASHGNPGAYTGYLVCGYGSTAGCETQPSADTGPRDQGQYIGGVDFSAGVAYQSGVDENGNGYDQGKAWGYAVKITSAQADGEEVGFDGIDLDNSNFVMKNQGGVLVCRDWAVRGPSQTDSHMAFGGQSVGPKSDWEVEVDNKPWGGVESQFRGGPHTILPRIQDTWLTVEMRNADGDIQTPYEPYIESPFTGTWKADLRSWPVIPKSPPSYLQFNLMAAPLKDIVELDETDARLAAHLPLPIQVSPPRKAINSVETYQPLEVRVARTIELNRPDGNRPSEWQTAMSQVTVIEADTSTFRISHGSNSSMEVSRTLLTNWRNYLTPGQSDFSMEGYRILKHNFYGSIQQNYPEDIWWYQTYRYARVKITSPVDGDLELRADWVKPTIFDDHMTGSERIDNFEVTYEENHHSWTLPVKAGTYYYEIDLLFPNGGGPRYIGRVEKLTLSGMKNPPLGQTYSYVLHEFNLIVKQDQLSNDSWGTPIGSWGTNSTIKVGFGLPIRRGDYSVLVINIQGAFVMGDYPDQENKTDEVGATGGGLRYWEPLTGRFTGVILDSTYTSTDFWNLLEHLEGFTVDFSQDIEDQAQKDNTTDSRPCGTSELGCAETSGPVTLGPMLAQCTWENAPYDNFDDTMLFKPKIGPVCARVFIPSSVHIKVLCRSFIWGGTEAIVSLGSRHAGGQGVTMKIYRPDNNYIYDQKTADQDGCVRFHPVLGNSDMTLRIEKV
jgi:hypothetical protein